MIRAVETVPLPMSEWPVRNPSDGPWCQEWWWDKWTFIFLYQSMILDFQTIRGVAPWECQFLCNPLAIVVNGSSYETEEQHE